MQKVSERPNIQQKQNVDLSFNHDIHLLYFRSEKQFPLLSSRKILGHETMSKSIYKLSTDNFFAKGKYTSFELFLNLKILIFHRFSHV